MRFDEFVLPVPGDEFRLRFHPHLTVLAGVGSDERAALVDAVVDCLTGAGDQTLLTGTDHTGRPLEIRSAGGRVVARFTDDGTPAPGPVGWLAPDAASLRSMLVLTADDLGLGVDIRERADDPPDLADARATLRQLDEERRAAHQARQRVDDAVARMTQLDQLLGAAEANAARREYARAVNELDRVRAEAAAVDSGADGIESDRAILAEAEGLHRLARRWVEAADAAETARQAVGGEPIDEADVAWLADVPTSLPAELYELLDAATAAGARVQALEERLRDLATATMPDPDDPRVLTLATTDQRELWDAFNRLAASRRTVDDEQIKVGGLGPQRTQASEIEALEEAHRRWEDADRVVQERWAPGIAGAALLSLLAMPLGSANPPLALLLLIIALVGAFVFLGRPAGARAAAARAEKAALEPLGVATHLAFHLRRIDATLDPTGRDRLELAQADLHLAERAWAAAAGDIDPAVAAVLRDEVLAYANALTTQHGAVEELAALRRTLDSDAVPAREAARAQLVAAVAPYGVTPAELDGVTPDVVAAVVAARVDLGAQARHQIGVADAEADETKAADLLDEVLARLGHRDGPLAARFEAAGWAIEQAMARETVRARARPRPLIETELDRLAAEVRRLRRPEFTTGETGPLDDIDPDAIAAERDELRISVADLERAAADLERIDDRYAAVQRRVAALEAERAGSDEGDETDPRHVQNALLARLTRSATVAPVGELVPVLLDDPLSRVPADRKWELMDMLRRLGERTQLVYLTDDAFIGAWARRRAQVDETITLLEPVE